ncbi:MAG: alpha/beta hydrolase [Trueperaceae bacterium]|nr:alpha/beta hydrolase [Trueperaceae bacterium]
MKAHYAKLNGLELYYEIYGEGEPLILLHGGLGSTAMVAPIVPELSKDRQVIAVDLQAHGRTADTDRPLRLEYLADDISKLIIHLGFEKVDLMGYSLGGLVSLCTATLYPEQLRNLILVSVPCRRTGWYPEVLEGMSQVNAQAAEGMKPSPIYKTYAEVAPKPEDWPNLLEKTGDMLRQDYDFTQHVSTLTMPVLLIYGDVDSIPVSHMAEFYSLLGGSQKDAGWDHAYMPRSQLAILPGTSHYNSFMSPHLVDFVHKFLAKDRS